MVPICSSSLPAVIFSPRALRNAMALILVLVVVVPRGFTVAAITLPVLSIVISTATFAGSLKSSSKLGNLAKRLPFKPLLILTPLLPVPPFPV